MTKAHRKQETVADAGWRKRVGDARYLTVFTSRVAQAGVIATACVAA